MHDAYAFLIASARSKLIRCKESWRCRSRTVKRVESAILHLRNSVLEGDAEGKSGHGPEQSADWRSDEGT